MDIKEARKLAGLTEAEVGARGSNTKIEVLINGKVVLSGIGVLREDHGTAVEFIVTPTGRAEGGYIVQTPPLQGLL